MKFLERFPHLRDTHFHRINGLRLFFIVLYLIMSASFSFTLTFLFEEGAHRIMLSLAGPGVVLFLLGYEIYREGVRKNPLPLGARILLFCLQIIMVELVNYSTFASTNWFLYPFLVYSAYFHFGHRISVPLMFWFLFLHLYKMHVEVPRWTANPGAIIFVVSLVLNNLFFQIMAVMFSREERERKRVAELVKELEISHGQLQNYADEAVELAAVEERNRIAREIHDSLGHYLTVVNIQLAKAIAFRERDPIQALQAMKDAKWASGEALQDVRESIQALREPEEGFHFTEAVERLRNLAGDDLQVDLHLEGDYHRYNRTILMAVYRVIQEGIINIRKHAAGAQKVKVMCLYGREEAVLEIRDDGAGFDSTLLESPPVDSGGREGGFGLMGLKERLELVQGTLCVVSRPGEGTLVRAVIPFTPFGVPLIPGEKRS